ncbi:hypothetical protein [Microcystis aeruginosa]|jgi:phosphomevalonate kinase|uniref:hypothetical protein n=1 Tax=Microcystis aeruginosa TaxID=1126 RepID=UPI00293115B7|nr:hypothetical protein [Microcystis aeruginosa]WOB69474.1 hypothetical protein PJW00_05345 [Microcystis aeruginosa LE3]
MNLPKSQELTLIFLDHPFEYTLNYPLMEALNNESKQTIVLVIGQQQEKQALAIEIIKNCCGTDKTSEELIDIKNRLEELENKFEGIEPIAHEYRYNKAHNQFLEEQLSFYTPSED